MLIRFGVQNYRSFKDMQVFSMSAGKHTRHSAHIYTAKGKRLLKSSLIYGANASGKSNLIKAIQFGKNIALNGINGRNITNLYYRIDSSFLSAPAIFQYDFYHNEKFYSYGFSISYEKGVFLSEWLYLLLDNGEKCIFEREDGFIKSDIKFSSEENKFRFNIYSKDVKDNNSFLTEILSKKICEVDFEDFYNTGDWFQKLVFIFPQTKFDNNDYYYSNETRKDLINLLKDFDTGIEGVQEIENKAEEGLAFLPENLRNKILDDINKILIENQNDNFSIGVSISGKRFNFTRKNGEIYSTKLVMSHGNDSDFFELDDESDGTKRLFDLIPLYKISKNPFVIFIDELDRSFHTKLTIEFLNRYFEASSDMPSQLIVTLHDANVMDLNLFRQDEIWFVERNEHSSQIFSLNKFKERYDKDVSKEYILGRYGGIPYFNNTWEEEDE